MSSSTCAAVVGLGLVDRFALGAATGTPAAFSIALATGWLGIRMPTVSSPAVTTSGTACFFRHSTVSGPGQKRSMRRSAVSVGSHSASSWERSQMCTISGLSAGRPFAAKMARTASAFRASAPRP